MPKFAANLSMTFTEVDFLDRFARAAACGFQAVEFLFPYAHAPEEVAARRAASGLEVALFNAPPGDWEAGERGLAALPGREAEFAAGLEQALTYARALEARRVHIMAGTPPAEADPAACRRTYVANLKRAAEHFAADGIQVLIEPINTRDIPGFYLKRQAQAVQILDEVGAANAALQMDLYHCQIVEGDLATNIRRHLPRIGHFQIAGVPERHEPSLGEINYPYLFALIDSLGYAGWIGCEYRPQGATEAGLGWAGAYGIQAPPGQV